MNTKQIGNIGMMKIATRFMELGYEVFTELGDNSDIDLIVIKDNDIKKIQVKTTQSIKENSYMYWEVAKRRLNYQGGHAEFYDDYIDGFGLYCIENGYTGYIDMKDMTAKYSITLRLVPPASGQRVNVKMAEDYQI